MTKLQIFKILHSISLAISAKGFLEGLDSDFAVFMSLRQILNTNQIIGIIWSMFGLIVLQEQEVYQHVSTKFIVNLK